MSKILIENNKIIIDGHANDIETCNTLTNLCDELDKSGKFSTVKYENGYGEFISIEENKNKRFALSPDVYYINIYSNDGKTSCMVEYENTVYLKSFNVTNSGAYWEGDVGEESYIYNGTKKFAGFANTPNCKIADYKCGESVSFDTSLIDRSNSTSGEIKLYIVEEELYSEDDLVGYVTSFDNTSYPEGGMGDDGYYYERVYLDLSSFEGQYMWKKSKGWTSVSTLPYYFFQGSAVVYNNEIHILGSDKSTYYKYHYKYNSTNNTWTRVSTLPYNFAYGSVVVYNNEIHILGSGNNSYNQYHYKYNSTNNTWTSVSTLPYNFNLGSAVVYNNEIHLMYTTEHYKYNNTDNVWTSVSTLPYKFYWGSAVVYNNEIHILGGSNTTKHYKYNNTNNTWTSVSTIPYYFYNGSAVVYNNEIHILGGGDNYTKHYKYNSTNNTWTNVSTLPYELYDSAVVYNNEIHILGSSLYSSNQTKHYSLIPFPTFVVSDDSTKYPDSGVAEDGYTYTKIY